jgi:hypothetical protein
MIIKKTKGNEKSLHTQKDFSLSLSLSHLTSVCTSFLISSPPFQMEEIKTVECKLTIVRIYNFHTDQVPVDAIDASRQGTGGWGNPFVCHNEKERDAVCERYRKDLYNDVAKRAKAKQQLVGKSLACFCAPKNCHCIYLALVANEDEPNTRILCGKRVVRKK